MKCLLLSLSISTAILLTGCVGANPSNRSFSREWADQMRHDDELKARSQRVKYKKPDPGGKAGASRPEFNQGSVGPRNGNVGGIKVGGDSGLGANIDKDGGTLNYKIKW